MLPEKARTSEGGWSRFLLGWPKSAVHHPAGLGIPGEAGRANWRGAQRAYLEHITSTVSHRRQTTPAANTGHAKDNFFAKALMQKALRASSIVGYMCFTGKATPKPRRLEIQVWSSVTGAAIMSYKRRYFLQRKEKMRNQEIKEQRKAEKHLPKLWLCTKRCADFKREVKIKGWRGGGGAKFRCCPPWRSCKIVLGLDPRGDGWVTAEIFWKLWPPRCGKGQTFTARNSNFGASCFFFEQKYRKMQQRRWWFHFYSGPCPSQPNISHEDGFQNFL